jgi:hypothetical protein
MAPLSIRLVGVVDEIRDNLRAPRLIEDVPPRVVRFSISIYSFSFSISKVMRLGRLQVVQSPVFFKSISFSWSLRTCDR